MIRLSLDNTFETLKLLSRYLNFEVTCFQLDAGPHGETRIVYEAVPRVQPPEYAMFMDEFLSLLEQHPPMVGELFTEWVRRVLP